MMLARLAPLLVLRSVRAMSKTVILVRHGAVDRAGGGVKPDGLYGGDVDVPLSARGEAEARAAAAYVADATAPLATAVFASPMKRAVFGARRCAEACGVAAVEEREAFREVKRGAWVGRTLAEVSAAFPGEDMRRFLGDYDFRPAGGAESVNDVQRRAAACLRGDVLPSIADGECAVVVSHLFVTRSLLALAIPGTPVAEIAVPTASVSVLEFDGDTPAVKLQGLKPDLSPEDDARLAAGDAARGRGQ
ncbi:Histidine phosphatase [Aureococcus anophagefferens]|nr:Histidine phosphatase [Aureococcus anophagefferens]